MTEPALPKPLSAERPGLLRERPLDETSSPPNGHGARPLARAPKYAHSMKRNKRPSSLRSSIEWVLVIGGAILVALVVKTFLFQAFYIPSPSMSPTLVQNDRVLVNKLAYRFHDVRRGDIVVFERPQTEPAQDIKDLIKRVIALPGDRVSISADRVAINGRALDESYVKGKPTTYSSCGLGKVQGIDTKAGLRIPKGKVFVMGDNRTDSHDGRCFGPISKKLIVGRAFMVIWPVSKIGTL